MPGSESRPAHILGAPPGTPADSNRPRSADNFFGMLEGYRPNGAAARQPLRPLVTEDKFAIWLASHRRLPAPGTPIPSEAQPTSPGLRRQPPAGAALPASPRPGSRGRTPAEATAAPSPAPGSAPANPDRRRQTSAEAAALASPAGRASQHAAPSEAPRGWIHEVQKMQGTAASVEVHAANEATRASSPPPPETPRRRLTLRKADAPAEETPPKRRRVTEKSQPLFPSAEAADVEEKSKGDDASVMVRIENQLKRYPRDQTQIGGGKEAKLKSDDASIVAHKQTQSTSAKVKSSRAALSIVPSVSEKLMPLEAPRVAHGEVGRRELCLSEIPLSAILNAQEDTKADEEPRTRPQRIRIPPVEHWRNEQVIYKKDSEHGLSVVGLLKNCAPHCNTDTRNPDTWACITQQYSSSYLEKFQGLQGSKAVIANGLSSDGLSCHMVVIPQWLKRQKRPPTAVLPFTSAAGGYLSVLKGPVRLAKKIGDRYKEIQLDTGDQFCVTSSGQAQWLAAPLQQLNGNSSKESGAVLRVVLRISED